MFSRGRENTAFAYAFLWRHTGDRKYRDVALWLLQHAQAQDKVKDYGMAYRSTAYATFYLSRLAEKGGPPTSNPTTRRPRRTREQLPKMLKKDPHGRCARCHAPDGSVKRRSG